MVVRVVRSRSWKSVLAVLGLGLGLVVTPLADAAEPKPVTLGEVASRITSPRLGNVVQLMRSEAERELDAIDWKTNGVRRKVRVSASLVRLDSSESRGVLRTDALVSATLMDAKSGALLAIVEGRAQAEGRKGAAAGTERDALSGAVHGAIAAIPEAIRRMQ